MSDNERLRQALEAPFPEHAIKQRQGGGGSRFSYVEGFTIIRRLNEATGGTWDWAIKSFEFRPLPPLTDRKTGELKEQSLVVVTGELTIPGLGTRSGVGVQKVSESGGEDLVKGASTDALKKAATLFGVALDLYGPDYEGGEVAASQPRPQPAPARNAAPAFVQGKAAPAPAPEPIALPARREQQAQLPAGDPGLQRATERQVKFIYAIAREAGLDEQELAAWSQELYAQDVDQLNRRDASTLIEALQRRRNEVC